MTEIDYTEAAGRAARELFAQDVAGHHPPPEHLELFRQMWDDSTPGDDISRVKASYLQRGLAVVRVAGPPIARQASDYGYGVGLRDGYAESIDRPTEYVNPWEDQ